MTFFSVHNPALSIPYLLGNSETYTLHYDIFERHFPRELLILRVVGIYAPDDIHLTAIMLKVLKTKGMIETLFVENSGIQVSKWR